MKIIQIGTYSSQNKGDAAMEISTAAALTSRFGKNSVIISTPFPELDKPFYSDYTVLECRRRRLIWASLQLLRCLLWSFLKKALSLDLKAVIPEYEIREFVNCDLVVDLSGDMLTEDYGPHVAYSHFIPILMAHFLDKPYVLCAQSIGPFKWTRPMARYVLENAQFISVRDEISLNYLKQTLKIKNKNLLLTADMAFLLEPASVDRVSEILLNENINISGNKILGISLSKLVERKYESKNPNSTACDFYKLFANVLDDFSKRYNLDLIFIPHVTGPTTEKDDRVVGNKLKSEMKTKLQLIQGDYRPEELKGIISRFDFMIGARMHANIAALSTSVPTIAISYSHKAPGIMKMFMQEDLTLDILTIDQNKINSALGDLIKRADDIRGVLSDKTKSVKSSALINLDLISEILNKKPEEPNSNHQGDFSI